MDIRSMNLEEMEALAISLGEKHSWKTIVPVGA